MLNVEFEQPCPRLNCFEKTHEALSEHLFVIFSRLLYWCCLLVVILLVKPDVPEAHPLDNRCEHQLHKVNKLAPLTASKATLYQHESVEEKTVVVEVDVEFQRVAPLIRLLVKILYLHLIPVGRGPFDRRLLFPI